MSAAQGNFMEWPVIIKEEIGYILVAIWVFLSE